MKNTIKKQIGLHTLAIILVIFFCSMLRERKKRTVTICTATCEQGCVEYETWTLQDDGDYKLNSIEYGITLNRDYTVTLFEQYSQKQYVVSIDSLEEVLNKLQE